MSGNFLDRKNWTRSLTIIMIVAIVAAVIGCMVKGDTDKKDRLYFKNSAGPVLFDHDKHSQSADSCTQCHHDLYDAAQATGCADCHDDEVEPEEFSHNELKEIHSRDCAKCHEQTKENDQLLSCRSCHPALQENDNNTVSCMTCHDDDSFSPDMMNHDEYMEMEDHTCLGCHTPKSISTAYHTNCSHCHLENSPERFSQTDGEVKCGACHLR